MQERAELQKTIWKIANDYPCTLLAKEKKR